MTKKEILKDFKEGDKISIIILQKKYNLGFISASNLFNDLIKDNKIVKSKDSNNYYYISKHTKKGINLIFLDIDGVLNCFSTKDKVGPYIGIDDEKVKYLKEIVDNTSSKIVLISTWRYNWYKKDILKSKQDDLANYLDEKLSKQGLTILNKIDDDVIGRGDGILEFIELLKWKKIKVGKFIILDDEMFDYKELKLTKNLIMTSFESGGLLKKHVRRAIKMLNNI